MVCDGKATGNWVCLAGYPGGDKLNFTGESSLAGGVPDGNTLTPPNGAFD